MSEYRIHQDIDNCIGCYSCEIHCKANKLLPEGPRLCRIYPNGPKMVDGIPVVAFTFVTCLHCKNAWCVRVCPSGAMRQRPQDGIVYVDEDLCVGCKLCMSACPWGIPQFDAEKHKVVKCDLCKDRLDEGKLPSCISKCVTGCLTLVSHGKTVTEEALRRRFAPIETKAVSKEEGR